MKNISIKFSRRSIIRVNTINGRYQLDFNIIANPSNQLKLMWKRKRSLWKSIIFQLINLSISYHHRTTETLNNLKSSPLNPHTNRKVLPTNQKKVTSKIIKPIIIISREKYLNIKSKVSMIAITNTSKIAANLQRFRKLHPSIR